MGLMMNPLITWCTLDWNSMSSGKICHNFAITAWTFREGKLSAMSTHTHLSSTVLLEVYG